MGAPSELLDRVARDGAAIVVTKRGRPVAKVVPIEPRTRRPLRGSVRYLTDIVEAIGATALVEGVRLVTKDGRITDSGIVPIVW